MQHIEPKLHSGVSCT